MTLLLFVNYFLIELICFDLTYNLKLKMFELSHENAQIAK